MNFIFLYADTMLMVNGKHNKSLLPVYLVGLCKGKYTLKQASESTGYSENWLCILKHKYLQEGFSCLENKNKFRPAPNKKPEALRQQIVAIYQTTFQDVNFTYFRKCLSELYDIQISIPTLAKIMNDYGIYSPETRKKKRVKKSKRPRIRRECEGDLIQIDGTPFQWFYKFGDNKRYCLTGSIDDATGKITGLYMTEHECLYGYLEIMRQTCNSYGVPREIYSDRAAIFCVTPKQKRGHKELDRWEQLAVIHDERTQWQRILSELNINQILAWSPEAKGRVERMWRTIQGQLPVWLKLHGASDMAKANAILKNYIAEFNSSYSVPPAIDDPFWIDAPENLDNILQCKIPRYTDSVGVIKFHSYKFAVDAPFVCHKNVLLCISERGLFAELDGKMYPVHCLDEYLYDGRGETVPQVVKDIIYRYMYAYAKEISA